MSISNRQVLMDRKKRVTRIFKLPENIEFDAVGVSLELRKFDLLNLDVVSFIFKKNGISFVLEQSLLFDRYFTVDDRTGQRTEVYYWTPNSDDVRGDLLVDFERGSCSFNFYNSDFSELVEYLLDSSDGGFKLNYNSAFKDKIGYVHFTDITDYLRQNPL